MNKAIRKIGLRPGSVIYTGNKQVENVQIHFLQFDKDQLISKTFETHSECILHKSSDDKVDWYDVRGMHDTELIETFGNTFDIHPLALEGAVDIYQRPKFEEYDKGIFLTVKALSFNKEIVQVDKEHVGIYFNNGFIVTFQETDSDLFESVRKRIAASSGKIRQRGSDYLAYALVDGIVDHYYAVMDEMDEIIDDLEEQLLEDSDSNLKGSIHQLKKELLVMRRSVGPLREALSQFAKTDNSLVLDSTQLFVRDVYDHTIQVMDSVESYRDVLNGLQDLFMTEVSFRMNKIMQLLTLISTIFIPLTFLAGIYGMNFEYMPELNYKYGYFILLAVMLIMFIVLLAIFKRKRWI